MLGGDLRGVVRYLTDRVGGSVLSPEDVPVDGKTVRDILLDKHPVSNVPITDSFMDYKVMPLFVPVEITASHVEEVAKKLHGSAGLGGLDANNLFILLLKNKHASDFLRQEVVYDVAS